MRKLFLFIAALSLCVGLWAIDNVAYIDATGSVQKAAGKAEAKAELLGNMATPCTGCTAVEVTDGTTTVTLYKPTKVGYIKLESEE